MSALRQAARLVVARWASGDLAEAVRALDAALQATKPIPKAKRVYMRCESCGSEDVRKDAFAEWKAAAGAWVLAETYDACHCNACEGEAKLEEIDAATHADLQQLASDERSEANGLAMMEGRLEDIQP